MDQVFSLDGKSIGGFGHICPFCGKVDNTGREKTTLKDVACDALQATFQDEPNLSNEEKYKRGKLAERLYENSDIEFTIEELALIKKLIGKGFAPRIVVQAFDMLETGK